MSATSWVHALALGIDPSWRRRPGDLRSAELRAFGAALEAQDVTTLSYSLIGRVPGADLLLWRLGASLDGLEEAAAAALRSGLGAWCEVSHSFLGLVQGSPYVRPPVDSVPALFSGERRRHLVVYPFTKRADWYLLPDDARRRSMGEHIRVGRRHHEVRQLLANSFGLGDHDFLVAYETDDLPAFSELVRELRGTDSRRWVHSDVPILVGRLRTVTELGRLLGTETVSGRERQNGRPAIAATAGWGR